MSRLSVVSLLVLLLGCGGSSSTARLVVGDPLPEFSLTSLDGSTFESRSLQGEALINFWATWCMPCRKELPDLRAIADDGRVRVIGIALDEEGAAVVRPFVEEHGIGYPVLLGDQETFQRLGGLTIPYSIAVDASGQVTGIYRGPVSQDTIFGGLGLKSH